MSRRKGSGLKNPISWLTDLQLTPETKHSIGVVFLLLLAALMILGLFDLAGAVGAYLVSGLKLLFGRMYFVFPFVLLVMGLLVIDAERFGVKKSHYVGLVLLFMSAAGLLHIRQDYSLMAYETIGQGQGGGYVGWFISAPLFKIMGFWATLVVLLALLFIALFLTFNTSFTSLLGKLDAMRLWRERLSSWWYHLRHKDQYSYESGNEGEETDEPDTAEADDATVDDEAEMEKPEFSRKGLTNGIGQQTELDVTPSRRQVKIEIPLSLLDPAREKPTSGDIQANKEKIKKALQNFGIEVEMGEVSVGPTVTQYTLRPIEGVKLSSITALHNDLALALAAHPIRIEAPIPGKALVGIEVPNQSIATVTLREIVSAKEFSQRPSNLTMGIGKDVAGKVWTADLDRMPHLLIAGATGSGKSVCINTIIVSLLYQNDPGDLRFILVDPKRVELSAYNDLPYLLTPVITDVQKTINALKWAVGEMDERYVKLSQTKHKNIAAYNQDFPNERMPYIVVIIDELADLMAVAAQEVEAAIIRLAQMARAVGIHLVLATQRPSVNVITGLIKANITSRIAFAVASQTDSRTILDSSGAEKLLGKGDMLFISSDISKPKRLQSAFVSDEEIVRITGYIKKQTDGEFDYDESVTERPSRVSGGIDYGSDGDSLLEEARGLVVSTQKASASYLQRRLRVGYARAARLLDLLEEAGVVGPADGAKPREVLISKEDLAQDAELEEIQEQAREQSSDFEEDDENPYN